MMSVPQDHPARRHVTPEPGRHRRVWISGLPRLVLASQSPRRRLLLEQHGLTHDAMHPGVDDALLTPGSVPPEQWVKALAYYKAAAGARMLRCDPRHAGGNDRALVIGADTVCVVDGRMIGQPADEADARRMLEAFQGATHEVITGVALLPVTRGAMSSLDRVIFVDGASVSWDRIAPADIDAYLATGEWRGKAGAYNLVERIEANWPITYRGDPTTIMGLPMERLLEHLERLATGAGPPSPA